MSRFYAPRDNIRGNLIYIDGREARHILRVMRLKEEDTVIVFDGTGKEYTGFIKEAKTKSLIVEIVSTKTPTAGNFPDITLVQAIPKKDKMDYIIEKATELGVRSVMPILSERTVTRTKDDKKDAKVERWRKIATEAAKQCGRLDVPEIKNIRKFYNAVDAVNDYDLALMACVSEKTMPLKESLSDFETGKIIVFVGPEGDFTPEEIDMAKDTSCKLVSLGSRILKSDTAGLYLLSVLNHELSR